MGTASKQVEQDENQEILEMLENSAINFATAELDRSRLRKIRDSQDNFNLENTTLDTPTLLSSVSTLSPSSSSHHDESNVTSDGDPDGDSEAGPETI